MYNLNIFQHEGTGKSDNFSSCSTPGYQISLVGRNYFVSMLKVTHQCVQNYKNFISY